MLHDHPACRIPALPLDAPAVLTEDGALRPERAVIYNKPFLLLHHYVGAHDGSGRPIGKAELAGLRKTAHRLDLLLRRAVDSDSFRPLHWDVPEHIIFTTSHPAQDAEAFRRRLVQAEELLLVTLRGTQVLEFWRC